MKDTILILFPLVFDCNSGGSLKTAKLGELLKEIGFNPIVISGDTDQKNCSGLNVVEFKGIREQISLNILGEFINEITTFIRIYFYYRKSKILEKAHAVQIHSISPFLIQYYTAKKAFSLKKPLVYVVHDLVPETVDALMDRKPLNVLKFLVKPIAKWFEAEIVKRSELILTVSNSMKNILKKRYSISDKKLGLIPPILEIGWVKNTQTKTNDDENKSRIEMVYIGKVEPYIRGIENILKLAYAMKVRGYKRWRIHIIGGGEYIKTLKKISKKLDLDKHVVFTGKLDHNKVYAFLSRADVGLLLYPKNKATETAFPTKLLEYMATGKIIIASELKEFKKVLKENAIYVDPNDIKKTLGKINQLFKDKTIFVKKSRMLVNEAKKYIWENAKKELGKKYIETVGKR